MREALETMIKENEERLRAKDPTAFGDIVKLTEQYPDEPKVWRSLAYASSRKDDYAAAIAAMTRVMELAPPSPAWFFERGRHALMAGDYEAAIADFSHGLVLGDQLNNEFFDEGFYFLRAEAFFQLGRKAEARADLEHVPDEAVSWTIQVRSKAELLALCAE